jgi:hypothetical protein
VPQEAAPTGGSNGGLAPLRKLSRDSRPEAGAHGVSRSLTANNLLSPLKTRITIPELNQKSKATARFFLLCISTYDSVLPTSRGR